MSTRTGRERGGDRTEHEPERDERHVERDSDRLGESSAVSVAGVRPLHGDDPGVLAQPFGELSAPDVDGVDAGGTALQQDVGEATGRRTDVEADAARRVDLERIEGGGQLVAAARDVRLPLDDGRRGVAGSRRSPGLRSRRAPSPSPTRTLPASTSACARVRVSTRPRSTRSWSSRTRGRFGRRRAHPAIVAQRPSPRLDSRTAVAWSSSASYASHGRNGHRTAPQWPFRSPGARRGNRTTALLPIHSVRWPLRAPHGRGAVGANRRRASLRRPRNGPAPRGAPQVTRAPAR